MPSKNLIFVTNCNMTRSSGEVSLIIRRAKALHEAKGINTIIIPLSNRTSDDLITDNGISYLLVQKELHTTLMFALDKYQPIMIITAGIRAAYAMVKSVKALKRFDNNIKIYLDVQGALEEIIEFSQGFTFYKHYIKFLVSKGIMKSYLSQCDGIFVVTDELVRYCKAILGTKWRPDTEVIKIRCGFEDIPNYQEICKNRYEIRTMWGIDQNTVVFVFSGYRMIWQKVDDILRLFTQIDKDIDNIFFAFYTNMDAEFEAKLKKSFKKGNYYASHLPSNEVNKYLSACDVGVLLRDYKITNRVAFPNKFSEYLSAGLLVALNDALVEPYNLLETYKIPYIKLQLDDISCIKEQITYRQDNLLNYYNKLQNLISQELLYSSQIKRLNIFGGASYD